MGLNVLVTGAAGLVGRALVERLAGCEAVDRVWALDRAVPSGGCGSADWIKADVLKGDGWARELGRVDALAHLIGSPGVWYAEENPGEDIRLNILCLVKVLDGLEDKGLGHVVLASTCQVYGTSGSPEYIAPDPASNYGKSKLAAENYLKKYCNARGLDYTIFRMTWIYGPGQKKNPVYDIIRALMNGGGLHLSLESELDFVYVEDVAAAFEKAIRCDGWQNHTVNISSGGTTRLDTIYRIVSSRLGGSAEIEQPSKTVRFSLPNKKALALGWRPEVGLKDGVLNTFEFMERGGQ